MKTHKYFFIVCMYLFLLFGNNSFAEKALDTFLIEADAYRLFSKDGFSFEYTLIESGDLFTMNVYLHGTDKKKILSAYTSPTKLAGRKIFMDGNAFWLLDKRMKDPIRISAREMLFGQASAGDITRISFSDSYTVVKKEQSHGKIILNLEVLKGTDASYPFVSLEIHEHDYRPLKAEFFASSGILMKTIYYEHYETIQGKLLLVRFRMVNELNKEESSIELSNFKKETLHNRYFSREGMKALQ